jgi:hypothetical protein
MTSDHLHPANLPRDIVQAAAVCITMQAYGNRPIHMQDIWDGLYGSVGAAEAPELVRELAALLNKMFRTGLITFPSKAGTMILTDKGDESATAFRSVWESMGVLDITDLMAGIPPVEEA